ncbi:hypothetical protein CR513_55247, partial [Mucuna pruriens]
MMLFVLLIGGLKSNTTNQSSQISIPQSTTPTVESQSGHKSNSLALTVFANAPDYYPSLSLNMRLDSPTSFATRSSNRVVKTLLPHAEGLRRSPRLSSAPAAVDAGNAGSRKRKLSPAEQNCQRRSTRFSTSSGTGLRHLVKRYLSCNQKKKVNSY